MSKLIGSIACNHAGRSRLTRRILAMMLSFAMVMSNMSVYAAEATTEVATDVETEAATEVESETEEITEVTTEVATESDEDAESEAAESEVDSDDEANEKSGSFADAFADNDSIISSNNTTTGENMKEYVLDIGALITDGTLTVVSKDSSLSYTDIGDGGKFSIVAGGGTLSIATASASYSDDNLDFTGVLKTEGAGSISKRYIKFDASAGGKVAAYAKSGSSGTARDIILANSDGTALQTTSVDGVGKLEYTFTSNGTYYLYGGANIQIFYVSLITEAESTSESTVWSSIKTPTIDSTAQLADTDDADGDGNVEELTGDIEVVVGSAAIDSTDSITVYMYDTDEITDDTEPVGKVTKSGSSVEDDKLTVTFSPSASGTYYFKAVKSRTDETDIASELSDGTEFVLPLAAPTMYSAENVGNATLELSWELVSEATSYKIAVYSSKTLAEDVLVKTYDVTEAVNTYQISDLTVGTLYYFVAAAVRGEEISDYSADYVRARLTQDAAATKYYVDLDQTSGLLKLSDSTSTTTYSGLGTKVKYYGEGDEKKLVQIEVSDNMLVSEIKDGKTINGTTYYFSIQGSVNPSPNGGKIPSTGAAFKLTPAEKTQITFVTGSASKTWYFLKVSKEKDESGIVTSETIEDYKSDTSVPEGSLSFVMDAGYTYYFYASGSKVKVYDIYYSTYTETEKLAWSEVDAPVITGVSVTEETAGSGVYNQISVNVTGEVGTEGGDSLTVEMFNEEGSSQGTSSTTAEKTSHVFTFTPSASGTYTFTASLEREAEKDDMGNITTDYDPKEDSWEDGIAFTLPLSEPAMSSVTNLGGGKVEVEWASVKEATGYIVKVYSDEASAEEQAEGTEVTSAESTSTSVNIEGLTVGATYYFKAAATRTTTTIDAATGEETSVTETSAYSDAFEKVISQDAQTKWSFAAYGSSTSITSTTYNKNGEVVPKNGFSDAVVDDDNNLSEVTVWSMGGAGKVVPATVDGLAFYYTEIDPSTTNFTLSATAYVNEWVLSNGQDGFGLMAADQVGENGNGDYLWTNSYQAVVSKIEYYWDGEKVTTDSTKPKISMKIGVGATEKTGATKEDVDLISAGDLTQPTNWSTSQTPLDTTYAKYASAAATATCNMVGNSGAWDTSKGEWVASEVASAGSETYTEFKLTLQKNNTGYFLSFEMPDGTVMTKKYYDTEALNQIISDKVYVGFFAARNANVTFKDISFTTIAPEDDAPAEEQDTTTIALTTTIASASTTNTSDYDLIFTSNWSGSLVVRNSDNAVVAERAVTGSLDTVKAALEDGDNDKDTKARITLSDLELGSNDYTLTFTPDKNMANAPAYTALESYDAVTLLLSVEYRLYGDENSIIYVAPNGKSTGSGTKDYPLDVYTAVKYAQPGQVIYLAGGTYSLYKTIKIEPGIDGEAGESSTDYSKYIKMMADPDAEERPVFDFNEAVTGMTIGGSYWYFKGFDVTRSLDAQKGIQVSGSHNVLDQVNAYKNGNTGIQLSRYSGSDTYQDWPSYNLILNCTSFLNADAGYEDADGFAAKLTIGSGNVFDGCIAAYNADDGWDLFAKIESGQIGAVTIKNCVAYKNGYVLKNDEGELDLEGSLVDAGNGNGFKMGGDGLAGGSVYDSDYTTDSDGNPVYSGHKLINSVAFGNKSKGFDSNSCPNNKIYNSISFNNEGSNVALYTYSNVKTTGYATDGVISFRTTGKSTADEISAKNQTSTDYTNDTTYLWNVKQKAAVNASGAVWLESYFKSTTFNATNTVYADSKGLLLGRNSDGTINMNGFLEITDAGRAVLENAGLGSTASATDDSLTDGKSATDGSVSSGDSEITDDTTSEEFAQELNEVTDTLSSDSNYGLYVKYIETVEYTGSAVQPEFRVYLNGALFTSYKASYKNNVNAYVAGDERYSGIADTKRPTLTLTLTGSYQGTYDYYFDINPVDITDSSKVSVSGLSGVADGSPKKFSPTLVYNGKKLSAGKDYTVTADASYTEANEVGYDVTIDASKASSGNFTGTLDTKFVLIDSAKATDISKMSFKLKATSFNYTGNAIEPAVTSTSGVTVDTEGTSGIKVSYINNTDVGKATATITGDGSTVTSDGRYYVGSKTLTFTIKKTALKKDDTVTITGMKASFAYTGASLSPATIKVAVADENGKSVTIAGVKKGSSDVNSKENGLYKYGYTYQYKSNKEAGTATLTITGIHNFTGSAKYTFKITPVAATPTVTSESTSSSGLVVKYSTSATYTPNGTAPTVSIKYNGNTVSKKNYSISYKNNKNVGDTATATITWKGSLKGTAKSEFRYSITACDISNVTLKSVTDVFTNGKTTIKNSDLEKSKVVLLNGKKTLTKKRDYTLSYEYTQTSGDTTTTVTYDSSDSSAAKTEISVPEAGLDVTVYATPVSGGNYSGDKTAVAEFRVAYYNIAQAKFQLIDKSTGKTTKLYFVDDTETQVSNLGALNKLNNHTKDANSTAPYYLVVSHSKTGELEFASYASKGSSSQADYTYDYDSTAATSAGKKSVTMYGTGLFGGTKTFSYTLNQKTYNLKSGAMSKDAKIEIAADLTDTDAIKTAVDEALSNYFIINGSALDAEYVDYTAPTSLAVGDKVTLTLTGAYVNGIKVYSGEKKVSIKVAQTSSSNSETTTN